MSSTRQLKTFFQEKDLDEQVYEVVAKGGTTNLICTTEVITTLLSAGDDIQSKALSILRLIDRANGDVHNFLRHLAEGMAFDLEDVG